MESISFLISLRSGPPDVDMGAGDTNRDTGNSHGNTGKPDIDATTTCRFENRCAGFLYDLADRQCVGADWTPAI